MGGNDNGLYIMNLNLMDGFIGNSELSLRLLGVCVLLHLFSLPCRLSTAEVIGFAGGILGFIRQTGGGAVTRG